MTFVEHFDGKAFHILVNRNNSEVVERLENNSELSHRNRVIELMENNLGVEIVAVFETLQITEYNGEHCPCRNNGDKLLTAEDFTLAE